MGIVPISEPFSIELDGGAHPPHGESALALCALHFDNAEPAPFAFMGTDQYNLSVIPGTTVNEPGRRYASLNINVTDLSPACTRLVIAVHVEAIKRPFAHSGIPAINPTLKYLTYSIRALGFGHSAFFMDEDAVYGVELLTLKRGDRGWSLDDSQRPASYPELVELAWEHGGIELDPWPA